MPYLNVLRHLAWLRLLIGSLALALMLALLFGALLWLRLRGLNAESGALIEAGCQGLQPMDMSSCIGQNLFVWLWQPTWVAKVFSLLTVAATLPSWWLLHRQPLPAVHGLLLGLSSGVMLLFMLDPGRLAALSSLFGAGLGGLLASAWQQRTKKITPSSGL